jgi:acetyl esterase/lipase
MKTKISLLLLFTILIFQQVISQTILPLYPDSIPNSKPSVDEEEASFRDGVHIISKISRPTITVYSPPKNKANGTAVIIFPGGGYWIEATVHEGSDVAKKFTEMGVTAFVVKYRIPNKIWMVNTEIGPLQDGQQAIKMVRENAVKWHINPNRIGVMGFSAGGHLASTTGTHFKKVLIPNSSNTSVRPDFMILIYPVISFMPGIGHQGSAEQLIGKNATPEKQKEYSNELQITAETPPAFLVHASNDDGVSPMNSIEFYNALIKNNVPAELHLYQTGGHGFGLNMKNSKELWMDRCKNWLLLNGWLTRK